MTATARRAKTKYPGILKDTASGKYVARCRDRNGRQIGKTFATLDAARDWQAGQRVDPTSAPKRTTVTFAAYADTVPAMHPEWRPGTVAAWTSRVNRVRSSLGPIRLDRMTAGDVRRALAELHAAGRADSTVAATRGLVTAVYVHALADELVDTSPMVKMGRARPLDKSAASRHAALTRDQYGALVESLPVRMRAFAALMVTTGLRPAEAAGLTVDRVDLLHKELTVDRQLTGTLSGVPTFGPPKTSSSERTVDLSDAACSLIEAHLGEYGVGPAGLIFTTARNLPLTRERLGAIWREAADGLDLPPSARGWHSLRHSYVTAQLASGTPVTAVSGSIGHANAGVTLAVYSHDDREARRTSRNTAADAFGISLAG